MEVLWVHVHTILRVRPVIVGKLYLAARGLLESCHVPGDGWEDGQGNYSGMKMLIQDW